MTTIDEVNTNEFKPISAYIESCNIGDEDSATSLGIENDITNTDISISSQEISYSAMREGILGDHNLSFSITADGYKEYEYGYTICWNNVEVTSYVSVGESWKVSAVLKWHQF